MEAATMESCLSALGDAAAKPDQGIREALAHVHAAWGGKPPLDNRAAQVLSIVCANKGYAPRIRAAYARYMAVSNDIPRVFSQGIPIVDKLPARHWICFYLARALGRLGDTGSVETLLAALKTPGEHTFGSPDPLGPGLIFLHNDLTPCWRAAAAWGLGEIGDKRAIPELLKVAGDFDNATDTRHAAAVALGKLADPTTRVAMRKLAKGYPEVSTRETLVKMSVRGLAGN
jgi:HEAT repeat protein